MVLNYPAISPETMSNKDDGGETASGVHGRSIRTKLGAAEFWIYNENAAA